MHKSRSLIHNEVKAYAQFLLDACPNTDSISKMSSSLNFVKELYLTHPNFKDVMKDSSCEAKEKINLIEDIFGELDKTLLETLCVMAQRGDFWLICRISNEFTNLSEDKLDVVFIDVTTAVELDDNLRNLIKKKYSAQFAKDIILREHIDKSIIGGVLLDAQGKRIDKTVATQLAAVNVAFKSHESVGEN